MKNNLTLIRRMPMIAICILVAACQPQSVKPPVEDGPVFRRGVVSLQAQGLVFQPCYVRKQERINDQTQRLDAYFKSHSDKSAYVELSGGQLDPSKPWLVQQVHLIGGNQFTCNYELPGNRFRAAGDKPLWVADVRDQGIFVQNYGRFAQLVFPVTTPESIGRGYEWRTELSSGLYSGELILRLNHQRCRDSYGAEYEYQAEMILDGFSFFGCARQGNLDKRSLPGLYSTELPGLKSVARFIALDLMSEGEFVLTQDYRNNQPLIIQRGTWKKLGQDKLMLYITSTDGRDERDILIYQRDKTGQLVLQGYNSTYGKAGMRLERVGPERSHRKYSIALDK